MQEYNMYASIANSEKLLVKMELFEFIIFIKIPIKNMLVKFDK